MLRKRKCYLLCCAVHKLQAHPTQMPKNRKPKSNRFKINYLLIPTAVKIFNLEFTSSQDLHTLRLSTRRPIQLLKNSLKRNEGDWQDGQLLLSCILYDIQWTRIPRTSDHRSAIQKLKRHPPPSSHKNRAKYKFLNITCGALFWIRKLSNNFRMFTAYNMHKCIYRRQFPGLLCLQRKLHCAGTCRLKSEGQAVLGRQL